MQMPKMKAALRQFISTHMNWIESIASHYVKGKQVPLELHLKCLCNLEGKLDELRILIISRCFHVHTLILIDGSYWTSRAKNDYKNTLVKLAFCGEGIYKELSPVAKEDSVDVNTVIKKVDVLEKGCDEKDLQGTGLVTDSETAQPEDSGNESDENKHYFIVNGMRYKGIQKDDYDTEKQKLMDLMNVPVESDSEDEEASISSEDEGVQQDLWLPAAEKCCRRPAQGKKPKSPPQPDPASNNSVDPNNSASQPTQQVCFRRTNCEDPYVCFYCQESCVMLISFRMHMEMKHPNDLYPCENCNKMFKSFNGLLKHQRSHEYLKWVCDDCDYKCQFPGQLSCHQKTHTKVQLVPCQVDECKKEFTDKYSMKSHMKIHTMSLECDLCPTSTEKHYNCTQSLSQHKWGQHGPGWTSYCGINYKWKSRYSQHIKKCNACGKF